MVDSRTSPLTRHERPGYSGAAGYQRSLLHGFKIHERALLVEDRPELVASGLRQISLCLKDQAACGCASGELLLLGFEPPFGQVGCNGS